MFDNCLVSFSIIIFFPITQIPLCQISSLKGEMGSLMKEHNDRLSGGMIHPNLKKLEEKSERSSGGGWGKEDREGQVRRGVRGGAESENRS